MIKNTTQESNMTLTAQNEALFITVATTIRGYSKTEVLEALDGIRARAIEFGPLFCNDTFRVALLKEANGQ